MCLPSTRISATFKRIKSCRTCSSTRKKKVKPLTEDRVLSDDIKNIYDLISKEELTLLVEERIGELQ